MLLASLSNHDDEDGKEKMKKHIQYTKTKSWTRDYKENPTIAN